MTRYLPARHYLWLGITAGVLAVCSGWVGWQSPLAFIPAALFVLTAAFLFLMASRPAVEIHEGYLTIGRRMIPWIDIRRLDRTGWISPLIVRITLFDDSRLVLIYSGDLDSCNRLLRHLRRLSRMPSSTASRTASIGVKCWPPARSANRRPRPAIASSNRRMRQRSSVCTSA